jgi:hypothetical protein
MIQDTLADILELIIGSSLMTGGCSTLHIYLVKPGPLSALGRHFRLADDGHR